VGKFVDREGRMGRRLEILSREKEGGREGRKKGREKERRKEEKQLCSKNKRKEGRNELLKAKDYSLNIQTNSSFYFLFHRCIFIHKRCTSCHFISTHRGGMT